MSSAQSPGHRPFADFPGWPSRASYAVSIGHSNCLCLSFPGSIDVLSQARFGCVMSSVQSQDMAGYLTSLAVCLFRCLVVNQIASVCRFVGRSNHPASQCDQDVLGTELGHCPFSTALAGCFVRCLVSHSNLLCLSSPGSFESPPGAVRMRYVFGTEPGHLPSRNSPGWVLCRRVLFAVSLVLCLSFPGSIDVLSQARFGCAMSSAQSQDVAHSLTSLAGCFFRCLVCHSGSIESLSQAVVRCVCPRHRART
jgi:hypothetical protein